MSASVLENPLYREVPMTGYVADIEKITEGNTNFRPPNHPPDRVQKTRAQAIAEEEEHH